VKGDVGGATHGNTLPHKKPIASFLIQINKKSSNVIHSVMHRKNEKDKDEKANGVE